MARYVNGQRYAIQDKLSILRIWIGGEAYLLASNAEEKSSRKQPSTHGKIVRGRGPSGGTKDEEGNSANAID